MSSAQLPEKHLRAGRATRLVGWGLLAGGAFYFAGGSMHPSEDPPGLSVKEHLQILFSDPSWYSSHALLLVAMIFISTSLVALARGGALARVPRAQAVATIAAGAAVLAAVDMLLHLVVAAEADRLAAGQSTPLTDVHVVAETLTVPAFGFSLAALAVAGARTRTVGNPLTAVLGVVGGVAYGLAGATLLFTDALNFLFPVSTAIALWAIAVGIGLLLRSRAASPARLAQDRRARVEVGP